MTLLLGRDGAAPAAGAHASMRDIPRDTSALCERIMAAAPGEAIVYHLGLLVRDRDRVASELTEAQRCELNAVAGYAWRLAEAGWCHLLQRRVALECFAYLLVVRPRPRQQRAAVPAPPAQKRRVTYPVLVPALAEAA